MKHSLGYVELYGPKPTKHPILAALGFALAVVYGLAVVYIALILSFSF
jgi:hypothetical protein